MLRSHLVNCVVHNKPYFRLSNFQMFLHPVVLQLLTYILYFHVSMLSWPLFSILWPWYQMNFSAQSFKGLFSHYKSAARSPSHYVLLNLPLQVFFTRSTALHRPRECVYIDLFGPWSFDHKDRKQHQFCSVSIIDNGLRWIELHEYSSKSSEELSLMTEWQCRYSLPTSEDGCLW